MKIIRLAQIDSTNLYAKKLLSKREDVIVTADFQTGGRGTKGRSFSSDKGGVYLTKLSFYENFLAKDAFLIMARAACAVCVTLESYGFKPKIKWVNDIYVEDKKICGILIENVFSGNRIASSIVGIGLNVENDLPEELQDIAISMRQAANREFDKAEVESRLIAALEREFSVEEYIARVGYLNREITLIEGEQCKPAYAVRVTERGELVVREGETERTVSAAEVSLRIG